MYKLHVIRGETVETIEFSQKPTFDDMYKQIGCRHDRNV